MNLVKFFRRGMGEIKNGWNKKEWWRFKLPSLFVRGFYYLFFRSNNGIYVVKEDWDNLIILDACSYELFNNTNWIKGRLEKVTSRGSHTMMFLKENFREEQLDMIYLSSNPFIWGFKDKFFKAIYIDSILPEPVADYAEKISKNYPDKRLVVHFLQPHHPFIGNTRIEEAERNNIDPYHLFAEGKISRDVLWQAYQDNLKRVLPVVENLIKKLPGKTVVTADHGEAFGAKIPFFPFKIYAHSGPRIKELTDIPWLVIEKEPRKTVTASKNKEKSIIIYENEIRESL